jgi:hypothetical protein
LSIGPTRNVQTQYQYWFTDPFVKKLQIRIGRTDRVRAAGSALNAIVVAVVVADRHRVVETAVVGIVEKGGARSRVGIIGTVPLPHYYYGRIVLLSWNARKECRSEPGRR